MFVVVAYWSFYIKTTWHFAQINNTDNKNFNNVTETCQAHYFPSKDMRMGHKAVAYHLNRNTDFTHPTLWGFFCKADDKLKSNSLFVTHSFNDSYAKCIFMQLDITKHWTQFIDLLHLLWYSGFTTIIPRQNGIYRMQCHVQYVLYYLF